jgi:hypothetical protein
MAHTTTPVRTEILTKLETALLTIPELKGINLFHAVPDDLMSVDLPALYLFEVQPEDRKYSNRLAIGTMHLLAQVFINTTISDQHQSSFVDYYAFMDLIAARLHTIYHTSVGLRGNGLVNIVELQYDRIITNNSVGVLTSTFDVEYRHDRGNAFS